MVDETTAKDLDETRRLLYGAIAAGRTRNWELVGTLANALLHHSGLVDSSVDELIEQLIVAVDSPLDSDTRLWLERLINDLTARLAE